LQGGFAITSSILQVQSREGWLEKQSSLGLWQRRYFEISEHYLRYYNAQEKDKRQLLAAVDVRLMRVKRPTPEAVEIWPGAEACLQVGR
jgi:hypothetical protein